MKIYKTYLWDLKPPILRQEIPKLPVEWRGLNYQNLTWFDEALKVTWLRRPIYNTEGRGIFPYHYKFNEIIFYGDIYEQQSVYM